MLTIVAAFTQTVGVPATGLTLAEIDLYLTAIAKADGAQTVIWDGSQHPTAEIASLGMYQRQYSTEDQTIYEYVAGANYTGATDLDSDWITAVAEGGGVAQMARDLGAGVLLAATQGAVTFRQIIIAPQGTDGFGLMIGHTKDVEDTWVDPVILFDENNLTVNAANSIGLLSTLEDDVVTGMEAASLFTTIRAIGSKVGVQMYVPTVEHVTNWAEGNTLSLEQSGYSNDALNGCTVFFFSSQGYVQSNALIVDTIAGEGEGDATIVLDRNLTTAERGLNYLVWPLVGAGDFAGDIIAAIEGVWDETSDDHLVLGSVGEMLASIYAATDGTATNVDAILEDTGTTLPAAIDSLWLVSGNYLVTLSADDPGTLTVSETETVPSANLLMDQGATWKRTLTVQDENDALVNLTGYHARMQARRQIGSDAVLDLDDQTKGGLALGGALGTIVITVAATATALIPAGMYLYDLEIQAPSGVVRRLLRGMLTVVAEVTR